MKAVLKETKRIMAVLLSVAMIFAYVPDNIYAAEIAEDDGGTTQNSDEENVIDESEMSFKDTTVKLNLKENVSTDWGANQVESSEGRINFAFATSGDHPEYEIDAGYKTTTEAADSVNGYQVLLCSDKGFAFKEEPIKSVTYVDYSTVKHTKADPDPTAVSLASGALDPKSTSKEYSMEKVNDNTFRITFPAGLLSEVIRASKYSDYDAEDEDAKAYCKDPAITINANEAEGKISKEIPMSKITVEGATTLKEIAPSSRTPEWVTVAAHSTASWTLTGLQKYVTDKTLEADMISVTYTEEGKDPVTVAASNSDIAQDGDPANYVQYTSGKLKIGSDWVNNYVLGKADLSINVDCSSADAKTKTISVTADNDYAAVYKKDTETDLDGTTYKITDTNLEFDVDVKTTTRRVKEIVVKENNDLDEFKCSTCSDLSVASTEDEGIWRVTFADLETNKVDDDLTITVSTEEVVAQDSSSSGIKGFYNTDGSKLEYAESGKALTFEARPSTTGDEVASITYASGKNKGTIAVDEDGLFTIPEGKIIDKLTIKAIAASPLDTNKVTPVLVPNNGLAEVKVMSSGQGNTDLFTNTGKTKIFSTFYGTGAELLDMWNELYGTDVTELQGVTKDSVGPYFAINFKKGGDWVTDWNKYGFETLDSEGTHIEYAYLATPAIVTGHTGIMTMFQSVEYFKTNFLKDDDITDFQMKIWGGKDIANNDEAIRAQMSSSPIGVTVNMKLDEAEEVFVQTSEPWKAVEKAVKGQPFYFSVEPTDSTFTTYAEYRMSDSGEWFDAIPVGYDSEDNFYTYRTGTVTGDKVQIRAGATKGAKIIAPENTRVDVDAEDGSEWDNDNKIVASANEPFSFTVTPVTSTNRIDVDMVAWTTTGNAPTESDLGNNTWIAAHVLEPDAYGVYTLGTDALQDANAGLTGDGVGLYVYTAETVDENSYSALFALSNDDEKYPILINTKDKGVITKQKLALLYGEITSGVLTADFATKTRVPYTIGTLNKATTTEGTEGFYPNKYSSDTDAATKNIVTLSGSAGSVNATGAKIGKDTITATLEKADGAFNTKVYTADLDVEVSSAYDTSSLKITSSRAIDDKAAIMADESGDDANDLWVSGSVNNKVEKFYVEGTNKRTGKTEVVNSTTAGTGDVMIDWLFDPDDSSDTRSVAAPKYKIASNYNTSFDSNTTPYNNDMNTNSRSNLHNATYAYVRAKEARSGAITVAAWCHVAGVTEPVKLKLPLTIIDEGNFAPAVTVTPEKSDDNFYGWDSDEKSKLLGDRLDLELTSGGINSLDVNMELYERKAASASGATSKTDVDTAVENGNYAKVSSGIAYTGTVEYYDSDLGEYVDDTTTGKYVAIKDNGSGSFTLTANKNTKACGSVLITITALKGGVIVNSTNFYVDVYDALAKSSVYLKLDDPTGSFTVGGTTASPKSLPVQQSLDLTKADYAGKTTSIVEPNTTAGYKYSDLVTDAPNKYGVGATSARGIKFTALTVGSSFKLPEQSDFDQSKIAANQVLAYWQDTSSGIYYPGEKVTVDGTETTYTAVWKPKYEFASAVTNTTGDYYGVGREIYNGNLEVVDDEGKVTGYGDAFATATNAATPAKDTEGKIVKGGSIPLVLKMKENIPYTAESKALVVAGKKDFADVTVADKFVTSDDLTIEQGGKNKGILTTTKGVISADETAASSGTGMLTVTATWKEGKKDYTTAPLYLVVDDSPEYSLTLNNAKAMSIEVDQATENTIDVTLKEGETVKTVAAADTYTYTWKSSDENVATVESVDGASNVIKKGKVTALKAGTATITLAVKDKFGGSVEATCELTVTSNGVSFTVKDEDGNTVDLDNGELLYAKVGGKTTEYTISASPTVTWSNVVGDGTYVENAGNGINNKGQITLNGVANKDLSDKGYITATYKKSGSTKSYIKKIKVGTFYPVTLSTLTNSDIFITKDDKKVTTETGKEKSVVVRVTAANIEDPKADTIKYTNIDLSNYGAVYEVTDPKEFTGWLADAEGIATYKKGVIIADKFTKDGKPDGRNTLLSGSTELGPVFIEKPISKVTVAQNTVTISNEIDKYLPTGMDNKKAFTLTTTPWDTKDLILLVPDKAKLYQSTKAATPKAGAVGVGAKATTEVELNAEKGYVELPYGTDHTATSYNGSVVLDSTTEKRSDHFSIAAITGTASRAGVLKFDVQSKSTGDKLETLTVNINGYDVVDDAYYENGTKVTNDSRSVRGETWFFNGDGKHVTGDEIITKADGTKIAIVDGVLASAGRVTIAGDTYLVGANGILVTGWVDSAWQTTTDAAKGVYYADPENNGKVLFNTLKAIAGKTYWFRVDQSKAKASDKANLYEKVDNYYVNKDGEVALENLFTVEGKQYLANEKGEMVTYAMTTAGKITVGGVDYVIDQTTNEATEDDRIAISKFSWDAKPKVATFVEGKPVINVTATLTSQKGKTIAVNPVKVAATVEQTAKDEKKVTFKATVDLSKYYKSNYTDKYGTEGKEYIYYLDKDGKPTDSSESESGDSPSEPEQAENFTSFNLFYTDQDITIALPDGIKTDSDGNVAGSGKWTGFFKIDGSGKVTVTGNRKDAAKSANCVVVAPIVDSEGNEVGEFEYTLPVTYVKPSLKLTSTSGTVNKNLGADQTLVTKITEKKSSTAYEPIDVSGLSESQLKYNAKSGSAKAEPGENLGEVKITAKDKATGKISVQPENWNEAIEVSYSVKAATKDVITANKKQVILNTNAVEKTAQTVHVQLNGADIDDESAVEVVLPNNWSSSGVEITEGVNEGKLVSSDVTFSYGSSLKKGNYTVTFKKGTASFKLKVVVSSATLDNKAVSFKVKSKINAITGQKMALEPKYSGIEGPIESVEFDGTDDTYEIDWDADRGTVIIGVAEGKTVAKGDFNKNLKVTVAGETCTVNVKTKIVETKPTVKIDKLKLGVTAFKAGTATGSSRLNATYKLGGKTFSIKPDAVTFTNGVAIDGEDDWYLVSASNVKVHWDAENGVIEVQSIEGNNGKTKAVKVEAKFGTTTVKKNLTLSIDNRK